MVWRKGWEADVEFCGQAKQRFPCWYPAESVYRLRCTDYERILVVKCGLFDSSLHISQPAQDIHTLLEMSRAELWLVNQHFSLLALKFASRFQWLTIYSLVKACELQKLILLSWTRKVFWIPNWLNQNLCLINLKHFIFQFSPPFWLSTVHKCVKMSQLSCLSWHICF